MEDTLDSALPEQRAEEIDNFDSFQETAWVAASQRGDVLAFNSLVLRWEKPIYNLALRMLQDREEAAEVTQDVFLSAFESIRRFQQRARFSTWLYRIAANRCITRLRLRPQRVYYSLDNRDAESPTNEGLPARESHEEEFLREESRKRLHQALSQLIPDQRIVVELKFFQDLTFEEIAEIVGIPLSTVKSRLYAGLEILKGRLGRASMKTTRR